MATSRELSVRPGDLVDLYDEGDLLCGVVVGEEKGRLRVITEKGREIRVTASRIVQRVGPAPGGASPATAAGAAQRHAAEAGARMAGIDISALWDVLMEESGRFTSGALATLALGEDSPVARTAILRAMQSDRTYFTRKGDDYETRAREQVEETIKREMAERLKQERRAAFLDRARAVLKGSIPRQEAAVLPPEFRPYIADLVELALAGDEAS